MHNFKRLSTIDEEVLRKLCYKHTIYIIGIGAMIKTDTIKISMDEAISMVQDMYEIFLVSEHITRNEKEGE